MRRAVFALCWAATALCVSAGAFVRLPLPPSLLAYRPVQSVRILDREGGLLRELAARDDGSARPVPLSEVPVHLQQAVLAAEDSGFWSHPGISWRAIGRAVLQNFRARKVVAGGSTLTQQLVRSLWPRPKGIGGKLWEALWALRLEAHLSKEEILAQYLNRVPLGNRTFGVEAASQLYFGRSVGALSLSQAAFLAALPKGPSAYNPYRKRARAEQRKDWVLSRMVALGLLSPERASDARREPLDLQISNAAFAAPHFMEYLSSGLKAWGLGEAAVLHTTIAPALQRAAEEAVSEEIAALSARRVSAGAVLVLDNLSGEVLAYVGSPDFFDEEILGQNDGVQMRRQPGSALKPFLYAEAFSRGYTPASILSDVDAAFAAEKGAYAPKNYDRRSHGPVRAREALANSFNVPAVQLLNAFGVERLLSVLHQAGFESLQEPSSHYGLGLALGDGEVSLWELARAYAGLSRGGVVEPLRFIRRATRADGSPLSIPEELAPRRFAEATSAMLVADILSDNAARARAFGLDSALRLAFPAAAKTGTSKGYSDNWAVGFTRERTVAVWAGNFDGSPMVQVSGITGAAPIFRRVMARAMEGILPRPLVDRSELRSEAICPLSGDLAGPSCPAATEELFAPGSEPTRRCHLHGKASAVLSPSLAQRCRELSQGTGRIVRAEAPFQAWAREAGVVDDPELAEQCMGISEDAQAPRLVSPAEGDEYELSSDIPLQDQTVPVRIVAWAGEGPLELWLDGRMVEAVKAPFISRISPVRGLHRLSLKKLGEDAVLSSVAFRVSSESPSKPHR